LDNADLLGTLVPLLEDRFEVRGIALTSESLHLRLVDPRYAREVLLDDRLLAGVHVANSEVGRLYGDESRFYSNESRFYSNESRFYSNESRVSLLPCVPYDWQFADEQVAMPSEQVAMPSEKGSGVNCFALISRRNECQSYFTEGKMTAAWISERLDALSLSLPRLTVVVLDNAAAHRKAVKDRCRL